MSSRIFSIFLLSLLAVGNAFAQHTYRTSSGIIITEEGDSLVRALEPFRGSASGGTWYADALNRYPRKVNNNKVRFYSMIIPTACEYYLPEMATAWCSREKPVMENIRHHLSDSITWVDVYTTLDEHKQENIYARTDHHWLPLGAFYAAREFARVADVPFKELSAYRAMTIHGFVGSMSRFSRDARVKNSPENFVYYVPCDSTYSTTYIEHRVGKGGKVTGLSENFQGPFFIQHKQGSSSAYCTFMGGDYRTTHVKTQVGNSRRLLIIKDSYGNALPPFLFSSFEEIWVVDFRYFTRNIVRFIAEQGVTDVLFANNMQHAYARGTATKIAAMLQK
jgi:hypothetical protein